jgi:hypothetical protein
MKKLVMVGWVAAFTCSFLVYPILGFIRSSAVEAWVIVGKDANTVSVEKAIFEPPKDTPKDSKKYRDAVMTIYGVPTDAPMKVVFVPKEKFVRPEELPDMVLLPKGPNDDPMQLKMIEWMAPRTMLGASVVGFVLVILWIILQKKAKAAAPPPPAQPAA